MLTFGCMMQVKPGDRVSILGIYKAMSGSKVARFHGGTFKATVVGVSVQKLTRENTVKLTHGEILQIRKVSVNDSYSYHIPLASDRDPSFPLLTAL